MDIQIEKILFSSLISFFLIVSFLGFIPDSIRHLQKAVEFYQVIKNDEMAALSWIKENTSASDIILCSGTYTHKLGWWVEGWAKRKAFLTEEAYWHKDLTYKGEREEAETASRILSEGDYILENGLIRVADYSFQKDVKNCPVIATRDVGKYQNLIFLDDAFVNLNFSAVSNPQKSWVVSPLYSENRSISINYTEEYGVMECSFEWSHVTIKRAVILEKSTKYVDISYDVVLINATMRKFELRVYSYLKLAEGQIYANSSIEIVQLVEQKPVLSLISPTLDNIECINYGLDEKSEYAFYAFNSSQSHSKITLRILFPNVAIQTSSLITYYNVVDLIKDYSIDYVFITNLHWRRVKWLRDSGYFESAFDSENVSVFKVKIEE